MLLLSMDNKINTCWLTFLLTCILVVLSDATPIWKCSTEKPANKTAPIETYDLSCDSLFGLTFGSCFSLPYKDNGKDLSTLETAEYGVKIIEGEPGIGETELREDILNKLGFGVEEIPYLGPLRNESKRVNIRNPELSGEHTIFFQCRIRCFAVGSLSGFKELRVYTDPLQYNFPSVGKCIAKDLYFPFKIFNPSDVFTPWLENNSTTTSFQSLVLSNVGLFWNSTAFHKLSSIDVDLAFFNSGTPLDPTLAPVFKSILNQLADRFTTQLNPSPITKFKWDKALTMSSPIQGSLFRFNATKEPNSATIVYNIVGICGKYTIITNQIFRRVFDKVNGTCIGHPGAANDGIEKCDFCQDLNQCADTRKFKKDNPDLYYRLLRFED